MDSRTLTLILLPPYSRPIFELLSSASSIATGDGGVCECFLTKGKIPDCRQNVPTLPYILISLSAPIVKMNL
jgi:hypothetical protein